MENAPSDKTQVLRKSMNICIWVAGTLNQLFVINSYTEIKLQKKYSPFYFYFPILSILLQPSNFIIFCRGK